MVFAIVSKSSRWMNISPKSRSAKKVKAPKRNTATKTIQVEPFSSSRLGQAHFDNSSRVWRKKTRIRSSHPFFLATNRTTKRTAPQKIHETGSGLPTPGPLSAPGSGAFTGTSVVAVGVAGAALLFVSFISNFLFVSSSGVWRRGRDSNPRKLALQRFSRPPHSTTLPPLRCGAKTYIQLAGREGFEPPTDGFGDRCSTN